MINTFNSHGTYRVGSTTFLNKLEAVYQASSQKLPVQWDFHNDDYSKFDWTQRPPGSIRDHYRERAQQLRDLYDHIIIPFSGGMDSYTVLHSFLSNNIHVDEIWTNWPLKQMKYTAINNVVHDESNFFSEFKYAVMPVLEYVKKNFPQTNIVINDYSSEFETEFTESIISMTTSWQSPSAPFRGHGRSDLCDQALKQNKKVARVYGYDKIKLRVNNNQLYAFFTDVFGSGEIKTGEASEFFYQSPKAPLVAIMQAHCLKDAIMQHRIKPTVNHPARTALNTLYIQSCYPDYPEDTFQTGKQLGTMFRKSDLWIADYNPRFYSSWKWTYDQYFNSLDDSLVKKIDEIPVGLKNCSSGNYLVDNNFNHPDIEFDPNSLRKLLDF